ncbi:MAG: SCO family protein [Candidatus Velthaea sp.]
MAVRAVVVVVLAVMAAAVGWRTFDTRRASAPDFTLVDQDARPFTLSAQRGHPVVLFFGYTHCPDVCPTTLAHLAQALHAPGAPSDARIAFITVDPRRDSPAALKRYVRLFDPHFIGLTGSLPALNPVYAAYHAAPRTIPAGAAHGDYAVAHATSVLYIGRDGATAGLGSWDDATADIARDLKGVQ